MKPFEHLSFIKSVLEKDTPTATERQYAIESVRRLEEYAYCQEDLRTNYKMILNSIYGLINIPEHFLYADTDSIITIEEQNKDLLREIRQGIIDAFEDDDEDLSDVMSRTKAFEDMDQYPIERDLFSEIFQEIDDRLFGEGINEANTNHFRYWKNGDEFYILHTESGTLINWYKHLGRCNSCNKKLSEEEYRLFAAAFEEELDQEGI